MTEDEVVRWHHRLSGHEFEQAPGVGDDRESWHFACHSIQWVHPRGCKESDTAE